MTIVNTIIVVSPRITEILNVVRFTGFYLEYIWGVCSMEGRRCPSHSVGTANLKTLILEISRSTDGEPSDRTH